MIKIKETVLKGKMPFDCEFCDFANLNHKNTLKCPFRIRTKTGSRPKNCPLREGE